MYLSVLKFAMNCLTKLKKPKKLLKLFAYFGVCIFSVSSNFDLSGLLPSLEKKRSETVSTKQTLHEV